MLQDNLVRLEARVNGHRVSAVVDSGAGALIVDRAVVSRLGIQAAGSAVEAAGAGAQSKTLHPVTLADLRVGPLRFRNVVSYAGDLSQLSQPGFPSTRLSAHPRSNTAP